MRKSGDSRYHPKESDLSQGCLWGLDRGFANFQELR
jgi:hypothetical protein